MRVIRVQVKPNSRQSAIEEIAEGDFLIRLKSPPVDGKANQELIQLLAKTFDVPKSAIRIKSGASAKTKLIEIDTPGS